jgi:hypothetical protein
MFHRIGLIAVLLSSTCMLTPAVTEPIGEAVSAGTMLVNNATTSGNATVFEGSVLGTTGKASTQISLRSGAHMRLFLASSGKLYKDHVDLIYGSAEISGYTAKANGLKISADPNSSAEVSKNGKTVMVAALSGDVHVFNAAGISIANMLPGRIMTFAPQPQEAGASAPSSLTGCPTRQANVFVLKDETSNVTVQLQGGNIRANRRVQVTGTMVPGATPVAGASQVINVTGVKDVGGTCAGAGGAAAGGGAGAGAGGNNGLYIGAAAAVVAGVTAGVIFATNTGSNVNSSQNLVSGTSVQYLRDAAGNIFTVTTTVTNGNTTQTITETTPTGATTTLSSLPTQATDPLNACMSPCH